MFHFSDYVDESLNLLQDEQLSFIPSVSLPSNVFSFAFKRRFGPSDKLRLGRLSLSLSLSLHLKYFVLWSMIDWFGLIYN